MNFNCRKAIGFRSLFGWLDKRLLVGLVLLLSISQSDSIAVAEESQATISVVVAPDVSKANVHYVNNRSPLLPGRFIGLPSGAVKPSGWLSEMLDRQRQGLTGELGKISVWLQKEDSAWLSKDGKGKYGWEELPYWLKGYIELAYMYDDPDMIAETQVWIEGTLASQRANGDFGPDQRFNDGTRDYWANMVMMFCLQTYYDHSGDQRVIDLMSRYFEYQLTIPDDQMLTGYWQHMRGGDNLYSIHWLYNRTGNPELLKLGEKIHRCTANWRMKGDLPNWHNVNIAECFREPAQFYQQSHDPSDLQAAYGNHFEIRKRFGQVPGGMFGGDENCRVGFSDPRQATETCGFVEQMFSDQILLQITGDSFWADHCENVAFNSYPAAVMPDFRSLRYLTAPNMVLSDAENHAPGIDNNGPFLLMNPFSSRCCQHNHSHGWPYFNKHLWMATPDNGVCAVMYSASEVDVKVGDEKGHESLVHFTQKTRYPFAETIEFEFDSGKPITFPFYLRIPAWCKDAAVSINGKPTKFAAEGEKVSGKYVRIEREWTAGDTVTLKLPMDVSLQTWKKNHDSVSLNYGPLTFSLKIKENYVEKESAETAMHDSRWQADVNKSEWPSFEIRPKSDWNYGLVLKGKNPAAAFTVERGEWPEDNYPFTVDSVPLKIEAKAKKIPEWTLDQHGLCAVLQPSPVASDEPTETVSLIPMGAARLRISSFPVIGSGPGATTWTKPLQPRKSEFKITASHTHDSLHSMDDGIAPVSSSDLTIPRFTWWDHRGSKEWVQYEFPKTKTIKGVGVYWFDDTGVGECRIPQSWRVLYREGDEWKPISQTDRFEATKDEWNEVKFEPIQTSALRIEVQLQNSFSGGILEWRVE